MSGCVVYKSCVLKCDWGVTTGIVNRRIVGVILLENTVRYCHIQIAVVVNCAAPIGGIVEESAFGYWNHAFSQVQYRPVISWVVVVKEDVFSTQSGLRFHIDSAFVRTHVEKPVIETRITLLLILVKSNFRVQHKEGWAINSWDTWKIAIVQFIILDVSVGSSF